MSDLKTRTETIRNTLKEFCQHFMADSSPETILGSCFVPETPRIVEHGPHWAVQKLPYVNTEWTGRGSAKSTCDEYLDVLGATLTLFPDKRSIPPASSFVIDPFNEVGFVPINCKFQSNATKFTWEEKFICSFSDFNSDGKIGKLEIWSESLSSWNAVTGNSLAHA